MCRITPAYAGKTENVFKQAMKRLDHPRVCGKNAFWTCNNTNNWGSPPRMREKRLILNVKRMNYRITPAYAGKTLLTTHLLPFMKDHPRVCGKNWRYVYASVNNEGSPPRMREKPLLANWQYFLLGITPAYAGKTMNYAMNWETTKDHPRVCGKNVFSV